MSLGYKLAVVGLGLVTVAGPLTGPASASAHPRIQAGMHADSTPEVHHDTSPPLRELSNTPGAHQATGRAIPETEAPLPHPGPSGVADPVVQKRLGTATNPITFINDFNGIGLANYNVSSIPPDPNAAVGSTQVFEVVNTALAVFSKTGTTILAPFNTNALWSGFGGNCQTDNDGDATVTWDRLHNRWVVQQFANVASSSGPYYECVAVSTSADATGTYNRYAYQFTNFPDYPKTAVWPGSYFVTYNMFTPAGAFVGGEVCAMDQASMLIGAAANQQCFTSGYGGLLAGDVDGSTPPPAAENDTVAALGASSTTLATWSAHIDWANPQNSTLTGPTSLTVAPYTTACSSNGSCIPQAGTSELLDSLGDRLMYRLAYRNFGDHESLVVSHSVTVGSGTGVRWYELRMSGGTPFVYQQGTYAPDSSYRWMGSAAQDMSGDIVLGYSQSSASTYPGIRVTGRSTGDPLGVMTEPEATVFSGSGAQTTYSRWGDYTSMSIDPTDDCTFWYTDEYQPTTGDFNWQTRLASFKMPGCGTSDFSISSRPTSMGVSAGSTASTTVSTTAIGGDTETVTLSATGVPTGTTATFQPSSITAGGTATLNLATSSNTPAGTYQVTVSGTGGTSHTTHSTTFTLVVGWTCTTPSVPLYQPDAQANLARWSYASPLDGASGWTQQTIGTGWAGLNIISGGDGVIYTIDSSGNLHWYQDGNFNGTGGASWNPASGSVIGTGWGAFTTVVSGGQGVLYGIDPAGNLRWYRYLGTNGSSSWAAGSGATIGTGWNFAKVVAGGSGVFYAVTSSGALLWYRQLSPLTGSASWANGGTAGQIGSGWSGFRRFGSMGGGVIFAQDTAGNMWWYRDEDPIGGSVSWANQGVGIGEGTGWSGNQSTTDVTGCVAA